MKAVKVTAHLNSPLAGEPPQLDGLVEFELSKRQGLAQKIRRDIPAPPYGQIRIPILRKEIGGKLIPCCSSPILGPAQDVVECFAKRMAVEHSDLLAEKNRTQVAVGNNVFKSYRLPLRIRRVRKIVWFALASRKPTLAVLKSITYLGRKGSIGYGRVERWEAEPVGEDWSWFAESDSGPVLMRPLPFCGELPVNLCGYRRDFGACQPPMWHPDRYGEIVVPV